MTKPLSTLPVFTKPDHLKLYYATPLREINYFIDRATNQKQQQHAANFSILGAENSGIHLRTDRDDTGNLKEGLSSFEYRNITSESTLARRLYKRLSDYKEEQEVYKDFRWRAYRLTALDATGVTLLEHLLMENDQLMESVNDNLESIRSNIQLNGLTI